MKGNVEQERKCYLRVNGAVLVSINLSKFLYTKQRKQIQTQKTEKRLRKM